MRAGHTLSSRVRTDGRDEESLQSQHNQKVKEAGRRWQRGEDPVSWSRSASFPMPDTLLFLLL